MHAALAPYVDAIVGYDYVLDPAAIHHGLPSTSLTTIVAFDEPLDCGWLDGRDRDSFWPLAGGLHARPVLIRTHGRQHGIQISFSPAGARALLGLPAGALAGEITHHSAVRPGLTSALHEQLAALPWRGRFELLQAALLARVRQHDDAPTLAPDVAHAWQLVRASRGRLRVDEIAARVGWSRCHLGTRFQTELGVAPKTALRLALFEHARHLAGTGRPLADVAADCGYVDQAHLSRDWRDLTTLTPRVLLAEFPEVQDTLDD